MPSGVRSVNMLLPMEPCGNYYLYPFYLYGGLLYPILNTPPPPFHFYQDEGLKLNVIVKSLLALFFFPLYIIIIIIFVITTSIFLNSLRTPIILYKQSEDNMFKLHEEQSTSIAREDQESEEEPPCESSMIGCNNIVTLKCGQSSCNFMIKMYCIPKV